VIGTEAQTQAAQTHTAQTRTAQAWLRAIPSHELPPGTLREVRIGGRRVMVGRLRSGEAVATAAACPHEQADLAGGRMWSDAVDCPLHHYLFDLRTGRNLYPIPQYPAWKREQVGDLTLRTYPCREDGGWILVALNSPR
jgi:3-phenylpropionate/trans-cinnamate dioxygenase ferredoxin subunit